MLPTKFGHTKLMIREFSKGRNLERVRMDEKALKLKRSVEMTQCDK